MARIEGEVIDGDIELHDSFFGGDDDLPQQQEQEEQELEEGEIPATQKHALNIANTLDNQHMLLDPSSSTLNASLPSTSYAPTHMLSSGAGTGLGIGGGTDARPSTQRAPVISAAATSAITSHAQASRSSTSYLSPTRQPVPVSAPTQRPSLAPAPTLGPSLFRHSSLRAGILDFDDEPVIVAVRPGRKPIPRTEEVKKETDDASSSRLSSPLTSIASQTPHISPAVRQVRAFTSLLQQDDSPPSSDLTSIASQNAGTRAPSPLPDQSPRLWIEVPEVSDDMRERYLYIRSPIPMPRALSPPSDDDDDIEEVVSSPPRRAMRSAKLQALAQQRKLLRKKKHTRRNSQDSDGSDSDLTSDEEDEDEEEEEVQQSRRRSMRPRKAVKRSYQHDEDDFEEISAPPKRRRKNSRRGDDDEPSFEVDYDSDETVDDELQIDETDTEDQEDDDEFVWGGSAKKRRRSGRIKLARRSSKSARRQQGDAGSDDGGEEGDDADSRKPILQRHCPNCLKCGEKAAAISMKKVLAKAARLKVPISTSVGDTSLSRRGTSSRAQAGPVNYAEVPEEDTPQQRLAEEKSSIEEKGGWVSCRTCTASYHFSCLSLKRKKDILTNLNKVALAEHVRDAGVVGGGSAKGPFKPLTMLPLDRTLVTEQCAECAEGLNVCLVCKEPSGMAKAGPAATTAGVPVPDALAVTTEGAPLAAPAVPEASSSSAQVNGDTHADTKMEEEDELRSEAGDITLVSIKTEAAPEEARSKSTPGTQNVKEALVLRCQRCNRFVHYEHLTLPTPETSLEEKARTHQKQDWKCDDCSQWGWVDLILAWRPDKTVMEEERIRRAKTVPLTVDLKDPLPREYLVKFDNRPYREATWVPHSWISITSKQKLKHFLTGGSKIELEPSANASIEDVVGGGARRGGGTIDRSRIVENEVRPPLAELDADQRLPKEYITPERVIDAYFWPAAKNAKVRKLGLPSLRDGWGNAKTIKEGKTELENSQLTHARDMGGFVDSDEDDDEEGGRKDGPQYALSEAAMLLVKWQDLTYEHCTWEAVPLRARDESYYDSLETMLGAFIKSRSVYVPEHRRMKEPDPDDRKIRLPSQPSYIKGGTLLPFQLTGVNWLRSGWYTRCPGILADEMGLGKTIQVISFIGSLITENKRSPHLVIAPNSTVANWAREFEKWLPGVRVVPLWGEQESTKVIADFELYHDDKQSGRSALRAHVVIMSESLARRDGSNILNRCIYWDTMVVDEGQTLKGGEKNLLYRRLNAIEAGHRLLLTGTPLNNNLGELFHLLNWLQPNDKWSDIKALEQKFQNLDAALVTELQKMLRPHFLRRTKDDVLQLPPKTEFIIPVSLRPIQKRLYKDLLEQNLENIQSLVEGTGPKGQSKVKSTMTNVLMQLRKCIQHPYLISPDLEDVELENEQQLANAQQRLVDASGKLQLLQRLLRKLKAGGHRALLFSQFVISLDIVEHFLHNEGYRYLRLDGSTGTKLRQKAIDAFNAPDSPYFVFLLSTRAGGVGINLTTADTVVIMDPDFNPHLDMQAIARAHRIGQKK
ncbi:hypothetical protein CF326_g4344, partial [Tilletia indica]